MIGFRALALKIPNICSAASEIFGNRFGNRHFLNLPGWIGCFSHMRRAQHGQSLPGTDRETLLRGDFNSVYLTELFVTIRSFRKSSEIFGNRPKLPKPVLNPRMSLDGGGHGTAVLPVIRARQLSTRKYNLKSLKSSVAFRSVE